MIKGNIVGLRAVEHEDLCYLRDWRNKEDFRRYFREVKELNTTQQELWFKKTCIDNTSNFMFSIIRLSDNKLIGACGLLYINWIIRSADFSFYIGENDYYIDDKGYALEASKLLIKYAFHNLNLHKIWMELYDFDKRKIDFFINNFNFSVDGKMRDNCFEDGKYYDSLIISKLFNEES